MSRGPDSLEVVRHISVADFERIPQALADAVGAAPGLARIEPGDSVVEMLTDGSVEPVGKGDVIVVRDGMSFRVGKAQSETQTAAGGNVTGSMQLQHQAGD